MSSTADELRQVRLQATFRSATAIGTIPALLWLEVKVGSPRDGEFALVEETTGTGQLTEPLPVPSEQRCRDRR